MKIVKGQALLFIYGELLQRKKISKEAIMTAIDISEPTFTRYMNEIRAFLVNFNLGYELVYSKAKALYLLKEIKFDNK